MLKHATGDLLALAEAGEFDLIVHGCNCFNTMGGGIARQIRERYPEAAQADAKTIRGDYTKLGNWTESYAWYNLHKGDLPDSYAGEKSSFTILNCYTQYNMSTGEDVFEYAAFELILKKLAHQYPNKRYGFPLIGQGLARGDPDRINQMLEDFASKITAQGGSVTLVKWG